MIWFVVTDRKRGDKKLTMCFAFSVSSGLKGRMKAMVVNVACEGWALSVRLGCLRWERRVLLVLSVKKSRAEHSLIYGAKLQKEARYFNTSSSVKPESDNGLMEGCVPPHCPA